MESWKRKPGEAVFYISEALIGLITMPSRGFKSLLANQESAVWDAALKTNYI